MSLSRQPLQIVEIDFDQCTRTYGSAPCTAALSAETPAKCFNMLFGCQDEANFDKGTLTLRFSESQTGLPRGVLVYPALKRVTTNPSEINVAGIDPRSGPMGKRARVTVSLQDFVDNDTGLDPYQAERRSGAALHSGVGYDPEARGTFFGRLRRRHPFYLGRALRVREGYAGEALGAMRTRHYVISDWTGPDMAGRVTIEAKDVLDLADNEKALCPKPSNGSLVAAIPETGLGSFDLKPATVGDEYETEGRARIGSEIVGFTRAGDTITLTKRALDGSTASAHEAGDLVQQCFRVEKMPIADVASLLLTEYAGIDAGFVPAAQWAAESTYVAALNLTATITEPTGVASLMGELAQLGVAWAWDEVAQEIAMRANRPPGPGETVPEFSDALNIIEGSLNVEDQPKQRVTQVLVFHGQIDATADLKKGANYRKAHGAVNNGGNPERYGQDRLVPVYCRWFGNGNDLVAQVIAERLAARFKDVPREVTFQIDAKDRELAKPGGLAVITTRALQDDTGLSLPTQVQITSVEEHAPGHALTVKAVTFAFEGRFVYFLDSGLAASDYDSAAQADKDFGFYFFDTTQPDFGDGTGGYEFF